ncbi:MAG: peptidoglycan recognition protein family protein [Solirubrobacterales bacterium]
MSATRTALACLCTLLFFTGSAWAVPQASDFERAVAVPAPSGAARAAGVRSLTIDPGRQFELVGFRWRGDAPRISLRSYGTGGWSPWTALEANDKDGPDVAPLTPESSRTASDPVWTGPSWRLEVRVRGARVRGFRAHFVHVSGGAAVTPASTGGVKPGASVPSAGGKSATDAPPIVQRAQWGAKSCKPRHSPGYGEVLASVVHHTDSTNTYSQAEAPSVVLGICRYHRNSKGWNDIGYNLLIDRFGTIYEGRAGGVDKAVIGAHAQGYNSQTTGIALVGTFSNTAPPQATIDSLRRALEWKLGLAGVTRNERVALISTGGGYNRYKWGKTVFTRPIAGHRDLDSTDCPGGSLYAQLPSLASFLTGGSRPATKLSLRLRRTKTEGGGQVVAVSGRLRSGGSGIAGKTISIEAYMPDGWKPIATAQSGEGGIWQTQIAPKGRYYLRGTFAGDDGYRAGRSLWLYSPKLKR